MNPHRPRRALALPLSISSTLLLSSALCSKAQAQSSDEAVGAQEGAHSGTGATPDQVEPSVEGNQQVADATETGGVENVAAERTEAMARYQVGDTDRALAELKALAMHCARKDCSKKDEAAVYLGVGIVQAGGRSDHRAAVQAFKKARTLDPEVELPDEFRIHPVLAAFLEASDPEMIKPRPDEMRALDAEDEGPKRNVLLMIEGGPQFGRTNASGGEGVTQFGGKASAAWIPFPGSIFTAGAQFRGGFRGISGERGTGYYGASGLLGGVLGRRTENQFTYVLAGFGVENIPSVLETAFATQLQAGVGGDGVILSAGADLNFNEGIYTVTLGLELGFGGLLHVGPKPAQGVD